MNKFDIAIIGAGPAGIMAAITAGKSGKNVVLIEKNEFVGRKILATGNGRCNLTNKNITVARYHGANKEFIQNVLNQFNSAQTVAFFETLGVAIKEEDRGRLFPRTNQASTIVEALKHALAEANVNVKTGVTVKDISKKTDFLIKTEKGETIEAEKLILATGGKAAFQFGSSGDGIFWAKKLGHKIVPIYAALVPLETEEEWVKEVQGIKVEGKITSEADGEVMKETTGDVLFTHFGLSGPAVMSHAGAISPLVEKQKVKILIDLYPEISEADLDKKTEELFRNNSKKDIKNALLGLFPAGLVPVILKISNVNAGKNAAEVSKKERLAIVKTIKKLELTVRKVRPLKEAQVSRGGVDANEIDSKTLESKLINNLFFAGEMIDVDADSGGFNLQWAWASGFVAGSS